MRILLALLLAASLAAGCGTATTPDGEESVWTRLPEVPLSDRTGPLVAWTGAEVLALGGDIGEECPPTADCQVPNTAARDGAALDPRTNTWRPIASAPVAIPAYTRGVVVAGDLFVLVRGELIRYDVGGDAWSRVRDGLSAWYHLATDGRRLLLVNSSDEDGTRPDLTYEPRGNRWGALPADPLGRSFDRSIAASPAGLVLSGKKVTPSPGAGDEPAYLESAILDERSGTWARPAPSGILGGSSWQAVGNRVVSVGLGGSDGGGDPPGDYGRVIPFGGALEVTDGSWSPLNDTPEPMSGGWPVFAPGPALIASDGYLYDDASGAWLRVPRPPDAGDLPGPAVWAGSSLVVVTTENQGGKRFEDIRRGDVWSWTPPTTSQ